MQGGRGWRGWQWLGRGRRYLLGAALALDASGGEHLAELLDFHALAVDLLLGERAAEERRREAHVQTHYSWTRVPPVDRRKFSSDRRKVANGTRAVAGLTFCGKRHEVAR